METRGFLIHALSPLHAGTGQAMSVIDLPIARMKATNIPIVPGSSIKGVLRSTALEEKVLDREKALAVFGPETADAGEHGGALVVSDARLLTLPVRSLKGTFAYVTSPLLLALAQRDLGLSKGPGIPKVLGDDRVVVGDPKECDVLLNEHVYLEDLDLKTQPDPSVQAWAKEFVGRLFREQDILSRRLVIVSDDVMTFLAETATQVDTRVRINPDTRTVAKGALWLEESLPPETIMVGVLAAQHSRRSDVKLTPKEVLDLALGLGKERVMRFGGKATVGRGRCRMVPWDGAQA